MYVRERIPYEWSKEEFGEDELHRAGLINSVRSLRKDSVCA